MNVTLVSLMESPGAKEAGRPQLTPELLAATGARYSRNNEGLEKILSQVDFQNPDKSVDSIFRMVDYGHQSIADMAPVAMFMDGISMWLAYQVWAQVPTAGGQESSTRYLKMAPEDLIDPSVHGLPESVTSDWQQHMLRSIGLYDRLILAWSKVAEQRPELTRIPSSLLNNPSDKAQKQVKRMLRNYAFDRARYLLPAALKTNMMLVMSARAWVQLCQWLLSNPLREAQLLGESVRSELNLATPRLTRHAVANESTIAAAQQYFEHEMNLSEVGFTSDPSLSVELPYPGADEAFETDLKTRSNRYSPFGQSVRRTQVRFSWSNVALAELRDLNRHRTGNKYSPSVVTGCYAAEDQNPGSSELEGLISEGMNLLGEMQQRSESLLRDGNPGHVYFHALGHCFFFEHATTADKFLYEAELRTGIGAHYRYAEHLRDVLQLWYEKFPGTKGYILEGDAEPE